MLHYLPLISGFKLTPPAFVQEIRGMSNWKNKEKCHHNCVHLKLLQSVNKQESVLLLFSVHLEPTNKSTK